MRNAWLLAALVLASPSAAFAQAPAGSASPPPPMAAANDASNVPPPPPVDDVMLAPVPPPRRVLSSWEEAQQLLLTRSTTWKTALDNVLVAEGQTIVAFAQYLPSLGGCAGGSSAPGGCGNATFTHQLLTRHITQNVVGEQLSNTVPIPNTLTASMTLAQDILNFQEFDQIGINELMEKVARMTVSDTKRTLDLGLATQIVSVVTAERSAEINRSGLRVALEQQDIAVRKEALGAATDLDVVRAKQNSANARASLVAGDEALRQAREALGLALGIPEEVGVAPGMNVNGVTDDALRACRAVSSVDERPDITAARENLEVAKRNLRNTYYSFIPVLTGTSSLGATSVPNAGYPNPTWSIGAALSIPIWDGGIRYGMIKSEKAQADIAAQQLDTLKRQAIIQVEQAQRGISVAQVSYDVAREQRDLAAQNDSMTQAGFMQGKGTSVDLVTASEAHREAEQGLAVAEFNVVKARLAALMALSTCPY